MGVSGIPLDTTSVLISLFSYYRLMTFSATEARAEYPGEVRLAGRSVRLEQLKRFALGLPPSSTLRSILLAERDNLSADEFLAKIDTWLWLARLEN